MLEAETTPGPYCDRKDFMSMKNPLTPAGIEPATFRFVAQHVTKYVRIYIYIYICVCVCVCVCVGRVAQSVYRLSYGLDGSGSNPGVGEIFRPSRPALGPAQPPVKWVPGFSRGYSAAGACC